MYREPDTDACVLCGSAEKLTREHKIKASALRQEFGNATLAVGNSDGDVPMRLAQSANSKRLKFRSPLCEACNTWRTQAADKAFEAMHLKVCHLYQEERDLSEIAGDEVMTAGSPQHLDAFRYFSKLLACQLAEMGAPVSNELRDFAIRKSDHNPINLRVKLDHTYAMAFAEFGELQYAAHGGITVLGDKDTHLPTTFYSTLTIGPIQYCFDARMNVFGQARLMIESPEFFLWCKEMIEKAAKNPIPAAQLRQAGLDE